MEHLTVLADSVGLAMLIVLDRLPPAERLAFVLHDTFGLPFDEIAPIVDRTPTATRQLASRARRRVRGAGPTSSDVPLARQREIVDAFIAASPAGDFEALCASSTPTSSSAPTQPPIGPVRGSDRGAWGGGSRGAGDRIRAVRRGRPPRDGRRGCRRRGLFGRSPLRRRGTHDPRGQDRRDGLHPPARSAPQAGVSASAEGRLPTLATPSISRVAVEAGRGRTPSRPRRLGRSRSFS